MFHSRWPCHLFTSAALGLGLLSAATAQAHFVLQSPPALSEQGPLGDPQKAPPCGDNGDAVATGVVTSYQAGDVIKITINETIFHPGHYRVALALNSPSELPDEPPVTADQKSDCGSAPIADAPVFPVLADGVFLHTKAFDGPQTIEVTIPADVSCESCTLQVIQFMANHGLNNPGGCYYHHCATISVEGGESSTGTGTGGDSTTTTTTTSQDDTATPETTAPDSTGAATTASTATTAVTTTATTATTEDPTTGVTGTGTGDELTDGPAHDDAKSGCDCSASSEGQGTATLLGLLALLGLRRRRAPRAA